MTLAKKAHRGAARRQHGREFKKQSYSANAAAEVTASSGRERDGSSLPSSWAERSAFAYRLFGRQFSASAFGLEQELTW